MSFALYSSSNSSALYFFSRKSTDRKYDAMNITTSDTRIVICTTDYVDTTVDTRYYNDRLTNGKANNNGEYVIKVIILKIYEYSARSIDSFSCRKKSEAIN